MKKTLISALILLPLFCAAQQEKKADLTPAAQKQDIKTSSSAITAQFALEQLKLWDEKLTTLKANFEQEVIFKNADIKRKITGAVTYKKPNLLKIEHFSPRKQLVITDRKKIFIYKPDEKEAYEADWEAWKKNLDNSLGALLDFGNYSSLSEKNSAELYEEKDAWRLELRSKKDPSAYVLKLFLSRDDFFPAGASLEVGDSLIKTRLLSVEKNSEIKDLEFERPKKVKAEKI